MARGQNYLEEDNCMGGVPRDSPAVVDKEKYRFAAQTVHVGIVSQATEFAELGF